MYQPTYIQDALNDFNDRFPELSGETMYTAALDFLALEIRRKSAREVLDVIQAAVKDFQNPDPLCGCGDRQSEHVNADEVCLVPDCGCKEYEALTWEEALESAYQKVGFSFSTT